jgi:transposase InsO family protein
LCRALRVSPSGFYAWRRRPPSEHAKEDERLRVLVHESHERSKKRYGSPRVHRELRKRGEHVSRKRIVRLMQAQDLVARKRRRYKCTTMSDHDQPVAANLLQREFTADAPNQRWVGDTTELYIGESRSKLYLAAILDLYSRFVVGWALSAVNDRHLTLKALDMALRRRCPSAGLLHHSDQGSTYASEDYQSELSKHGIICSMSRRGNCYDNAVMESWFSRVKSELAENFESYGIAKAELFDYIEVFYNQQRMHLSLDYATPAEHERAAQPTLQVAALARIDLQEQTRVQNRLQIIVQSTQSNRPPDRIKPTWRPVIATRLTDGATLLAYSRHRARIADCSGVAQRRCQVGTEPVGTAGLARTSARAHPCYAVAYVAR